MYTLQCFATNVVKSCAFITVYETVMYIVYNITYLSLYVSEINKNEMIHH